VDGTLSSRFVGTPAQGILHAKTGSMTGINSLSGYVFPPGFDPVVFSVLTNSAVVSSSAVRAGIDQIGVYLAQLQKC
jgi:D-alanyl-D-alanine carboxypeptidase/D-alanyl-D-alanine-endopeptidase (penicillin-binding protein 4)